uniref:Uncharacterized protein n=1 Tax=Pipistrellus kuhlii TaxID=59472 RepID=A0A7J7R9D2_PIPKU|nr:hypothetical protein mPipKuh1_010716 [Pipistrellus kuhlii]
MPPLEKASAPPGPPRLPLHCPCQDGGGRPAGGPQDHLQEDACHPGRLPPPPEPRPPGPRQALPTVPPATAAAKGALQGAGAGAGFLLEDRAQRGQSIGAPSPGQPALVASRTHRVPFCLREIPPRMHPTQLSGPRAPPLSP